MEHGSFISLRNALLHLRKYVKLLFWKISSILLPVLCVIIKNEENKNLNKNAITLDSGLVCSLMIEIRDVRRGFVL